LTSVDPFDSDRLRAKLGTRHRFEPITFKLDKFTEMQVRAKMNRIFHPAETTVEHKCLPADLAHSCATMRVSPLSRYH
jgi:hypothetical protein